jgi:hypothetical protein
VKVLVNGERQSPTWKTIKHKTEREARGLNRGLNKEHNSCNRNQVCIMKTKPNKNETWIGSDEKAGDVDRRTNKERDQLRRKLWHLQRHRDRCMSRKGEKSSLWLCPKWHPIPYIVHNFWPGPIGNSSALRRE